MERVPIEGSTPTTLSVDGEELLAFAGCNYLGLAHHPSVHAALTAALDGQGVSSGASRETTGNHVAHERLEQALAEFIGSEDALLTADGYLADLAVAQALSDRASLALIDADAHPSLFDAARVAGMELLDYGAGDLTRAHALLDRHRPGEGDGGDGGGAGGVAVLTDGAFPMAGRLAEAGELLTLLPRRDAWLVVDDSHGLGVLGESGRGTPQRLGLEDPRLVVTASLAKALGVAGGVVAGAATVVARVRNRADAYVGTTPVPPALAAAGLAALDVLSSEPERVERLQANSAQVHQLGRRLGLAPSPRGPSLPVLAIGVVGIEQGRRLHGALRERGLFVPFVLYPGAPDRGAGAFRVAVTSEHTAADLRQLEQALAELL